MKTRAAILVEQKQPLVIEEVEVPPLGFGQVLVKVLCSGICGSQLGEIDGVKGPDRFLPHLLGHEGTGEVLACGEGVRTVMEGHRVVLHWRKGAGLDSATPSYNSERGRINAGWVTTFNEFAVVAENRVTRVPDDLDIETGAMMGCAVTTGFGVVNNNAHLKIGESIVVFGAGGIGLNIVQAAAMVSAYPIIAVDLYGTKLKLAQQLGASHVIDASSTDVVAEVTKVVGEEGVDVAIDNTGNTSVIETAYQLTKSTGRTVLVGVPPHGSAAALHTLPLHFEKVITGSHGGESRPDRDIPNYIKLVQAGRLELDPLVTKRCKLEEVNDAIADMRAGRVAGRCMIHF